MTVNRSSNSFGEINVGEEGVKFTNVKQGPVDTEEIVDGAFANQETFENPDGFAMLDVINDTGVEENFSQSVDSQAGTYALGLVCAYLDGSDYYSPVPDFTINVTGEETVQARFYAKRTTGTPDVYVAQYCYDDTGEGTDYVYNLTAGDFVEAGGGSDDGNNYEQITITDSYAQYTSTQRTLPAGVAEAWANVVLISTNENDAGVIDNLEFLVDAVDQLSGDGDFEDWTEYASQASPLTDWDFAAGDNWELMTDEIEASSYIDFSTDGADEVVDLYVTGGFGNTNRGYIYQEITGVADTEVDCTEIISTKTTNSKTGYFIALDGVPGSHTQEWDFVATTWDTQSNTVTDLPGTSNAKTLSGTGSFVSNDGGVITIPASGSLVVVFMTDDSDPDTQNTFSFKTASATTTSGVGTQIQVFPFRNRSDLDELEENDKVLDFTCSGGESNVAYAWTLSDEGEEELDIMHSSDLPGRHNFTEWDCTFGTPTELYNPADKQYVDEQQSIRLLGSVSVDYKSTGQTTIYTVPTGYTLRGFYTETKTTTADTVAGDSVAKMGTASGSYEDVTDTVVQPGSTVGDVVRSLISSTLDINQDEVIKVDVTTADSGTDLDATVYLYGVLIPN